MRDTCSGCHWFEILKDNGQGLCHRHAPRPFPEHRTFDADGNQTKSLFFMWPQVFGEDFCGEFKQADEG